MDQADQKKNILITGATGLIGSRIVRNLQLRGHVIKILTRDPARVKNAEAFRWDIDSGQIDRNCLEGVDTIIHLAGAGIADKRWTKKRKEEIIDSRVKSSRLLFKAIEETGAKIETIISASGAGYYGNRGDEVLTEESNNGTGFLAQCCKQWEDAIDEGSKFCKRIIKLRIGIVLTRHGGALVELEKPVNFFAGAALGSGKQWIPWIHLYDMIAIFEKVVEDPSYNGVYNTSSPFPVTNSEFTRAMAKKLFRPVWPLNVSEFVLKSLLGEMSEVVLISDRISAQKLLNAGFQFRYPALNSALTEIYSQ
ncbi:MAG: TIGR01777 family oxidoreductase [Daejeonella sp.]|uniref:TIGR01777 family oxidoreductase n=1 Tax=Daejeonella sp. TaxID=2805397 RepID=UPI003C743EF7